MGDTQKNLPGNAETPQGVRIVRADEDQLDSAVLEEFTELLMEGVFHPVLDLCEETKRQLGDTLCNLQHTQPIPADHAIRATEDWREYRGNLIDHYWMLAADNDLLLAMDGEKIVGLSGCQGIGYRNGKEVYEIVHSVVLPAYRGRGISSLLAHAVMERMYEHSPDAYLLTNTDNDRRIKSWSRFNPQIITPEEHVAIHEGLHEDLQKTFLDRRRAKAAEGTQVLLLPVKEALGK
jgi:ribosomal protein S18 acetylase RimI-like enzyme